MSASAEPSGMAGPSRWLNAALPLSVSEAQELLRTIGCEPTPRLVEWARQSPAEVFRFSGPASHGDGSVDLLVEELRRAHHEAERLEVALGRTRERRRVFADLLRARGRSYRWIGDQLGVTPQAVDGFLKHQPRANGR